MYTSARRGRTVGARGVGASVKAIRFAVLGLGSALLIAGYGVSQVAALQGWADRYARAIDTSAVSLLSLALLLIGVILAFAPDAEEPK